MADPPEETERNGVVGDLLDLERRMLESIEEAQADADRAVAEAEAELEARVSEGDAELGEAVRQLRARLETEHAAALEAIRRQSADEARRYVDVPEARVEALAAFVARRVAEGDGADDGAPARASR